MSNDRLAKIQLLLETMPTTAGVYIIKDEEGQVIYVGKAKRLRNRLRQHFQPSATFSKSRLIRERGADIEVFDVRNENEALLLEYNLIQKYNPPINSKLKDDKSYPYIEITMSERYPRFVMSRNRKNKDSIYLGPYSGVKAAKQTLKYALKIFPVANCTREINLGDYKTWAKTCIRRRTKQCLRPCQVEVDVEEYMEDVKNVIAFVEGRIPDIAEQIEARMKEAAANEEFERAAELRDTLKSLHRTVQKQTVLIETMDTYILATETNKEEYGVNLLFLKGSRVLKQDIRAFSKDSFDTEEDESELLYNFVLNLLGENPEELEVKRILNATGNTDLSERLKFKGFKVVKPNSRERPLIDLTKRNIREQLNRRMLLRRKTSVPDDRVADLQKMLELEAPPEVIDVFDVSTLQGVANVASCIRFVRGRPFKNGYRKFSIKTVDGQDDFASMEEAVYRRYREYVEEAPDLTLPDLIVIDGGREQLKRAVLSLSNLGLEIIAIGLAKREEEIYFEGKDNPVNYGKHRPGMLLLRAARDEAHRFAVSYQRKKRKKEALVSILDRVEGIGEKRKQKLLSKYKTVKNMAKASAETMNTELGIPRKIASSLIETCRKFVDESESRERRRSSKR